MQAQAEGNLVPTSGPQVLLHWFHTVYKSEEAKQNRMGQNPQGM
jgi:hypothetical protein